MFVDNLTDNNVNLDTLPEDGSKPKTEKPDIDLGKFFDALEQNVNGEVYDPNLTVTPEGDINPLPDPAELDKDPEDASKSEPGDDRVAALEEKLSNLEKRYEDSSAEAKRLYNENQEMSEYKEYIPILKTMREDPNLINHVRNYLEGNNAPTSIRDEFNLPQDFVFDGDDAISNPDSGSAKVLQAMIDRGVEHRLNQYSRQQTAEQSQRDAMRDFRDKMKLDDKQYDEFVDYAKSRNLTLEDIWYLKNREAREKEIAKKAIEEREKQLLKMKGLPPSIAAKAGVEVEENPDETIFNAIKKAAGGQNIFGD